MSRKIEFERSSGNVFADLGVANPEQALAKAQIAREVNRIIESRGLNQVQAGEILGIDQPRVSSLSKGRLSVFSLEKMMQFAAALGNEVEISIKPSGHRGIKVTTEEPIDRLILSAMAVGNENIELSVLLEQQQYATKSAIRMDKSAMARIEDSADCELVAA